MTPPLLDYYQLRSALQKGYNSDLLCAELKQALAQADNFLSRASYMLERLSPEGYNRARIAAESAGLLKQFAGQALAFYIPDLKVKELYDKDDDFAVALNDLTGPDFEYPDWSHKTVGEVLKEFK